MLKSILIFILVVFLSIRLYISYSRAKWAKRPLHNFSFKHKGKEYWFSRSVSVTHFIFCKDNNEDLCVLANKRGSGTSSFQGLWNCPCGYLDFNENGEESAQRETFEETNLFVMKENIKLFDASTSPKENKQNVSLNYYSILKGKCDDYTITNLYARENEVDEVKWIPLKKISHYYWAFNHDVKIEQIYSEKLNPNLIKYENN